MCRNCAKLVPAYKVSDGCVVPPTCDPICSLLESPFRLFSTGTNAVTAKKHLKLAVIPGDGTGPEVTAEALKVLAGVETRPAVGHSGLVVRPATTGKSVISGEPVGVSPRTLGLA